jgi:hypothetical protein
MNSTPLAIRTASSSLKLIVPRTVPASLSGAPVFSAHRQQLSSTEAAEADIKKRQHEKAGASNFHGGGGGELNSPSKRKLPEYPTGLVSFSCLVQLSSADRLRPDQPISLSQPLSASGSERLDFSET